MRNKLMLTLFGIVFGLSALVVGTQVFVSAQDGERRGRGDRRSIEGTWRTTVTQRNCQTGAPVAPAFPGLLGFHVGGTLSGTSTVAAAAFGNWRREQGWQHYSFAFTNFRYNTSGAFIGTQTVRQTAEISENGNELTSTGTVEIFDVSGNQIGTGCSTATGTRFE